MLSFNDGGDSPKQQDLFNGSNGFHSGSNHPGGRIFLNAPIRAVGLPITFLESIDRPKDLDGQMEHLLLSRAAFINRKAEVHGADTHGHQAGKPTSGQGVTGSDTSDWEQDGGVATAIRGNESCRSAGKRRFEAQSEISRPNGPQQKSIGRWRPEEARRPDRPSCAVRVPWLVAEFNPRLERDLRWCTQQAQGLISFLRDVDIDPSDVVVVYLGNGSIQIRIPDGVVGCPIYQNSRAAAYAIEGFFDDICSADEVMRETINDRLFHPGQFAPVIGSTDPESGGRVVGTDGQTFLDSPDEFLLGSSGQDVKYTGPEDCPSPRRADFLWFPLLHLGLNRRTPDHRHAGGAQDGAEIAYLIRQSHFPFSDDPVGGTLRSRVLNGLAGGIAQGESWGTSIDPTYTGQGRAALFVIHDRLQA